MSKFFNRLLKHFTNKKSNENTFVRDLTQSIDVLMERDPGELASTQNNPIEQPATKYPANVKIINSLSNVIEPMYIYIKVTPHQQNALQRLNLAKLVTRWAEIYPQITSQYELDKIHEEINHFASNLFNNIPDDKRITIVKDIEVWRTIVIGKSQPVRHLGRDLFSLEFKLNCSEQDLVYKIAYDKIIKFKFDELIIKFDPSYNVIEPTKSYNEEELKYFDEKQVAGNEYQIKFKEFRRTLGEKMFKNYQAPSDIDIITQDLRLKK